MAKLLGPMFEHSPFLALPIMAMLIFMVTFVLVTWRTMRQPKSEHDRMARSPLDESEKGDQS